MSMTLILPCFAGEFLEHRQREDCRAVLDHRAAIDDSDHGQFLGLDLRA